jgi:hypothetical protein
MTCNAVIHFLPISGNEREWNGNKYYYHSEPLNQHNANVFCQKNYIGGRLAAIRTDEERLEVGYWLYALAYSDTFIGGRTDTTNSISLDTNPHTEIGIVK